MAQPKKARAGLPFILGILGFCLIGIVAILVRVAPEGVDYNQKVSNDRFARLAEVRKAEQKKLNSYGWANKEKGVVQIPIERAMELALADLKTRGVAPSAVKAETSVSLVVPPYVKKPEAAAPAEPAPAEAPAAPAEGAVPATPAAPETPAAAQPVETAAPAPAAAGPTPVAAEATPTATDAAPAATAAP